MNWKRYDFSRHYKRVTVEGNNPERLVNICLVNRLHLRKIKKVSDRKVSLDIRKADFPGLQELAGGRYRVKEVEDRGHLYHIKILLRKKSLIAGLLIFSGILFYQSLFISEIEVTGYESISEQELIKSLNSAGFYEGCRKSIELDKVKLHLYEDFDNIAWIGIKYKGNLAQITIAETDYLYEKNVVEETKPCNIVAAQSGYINSVDPEEGVRVVNNGLYVKEGDVIISGEVPLEKTTYEDDAPENPVTYVHASGTVEAKVPVRLNYCIEADETVKEKTGKKMITFSVNGKTLLQELCPYELSVVNRITVCNWIKLVRLKLQINIVEEVKIKERKLSEKEVKNQVLNEIHKFVEEKLQDNTQILNKSLNFRQEKNIIYIGVTLETLQEIGIEEEIIVDKSNRQSDQNDDQ